MTSTTRPVGSDVLAGGRIGPVRPLDPAETRNIAVNLAAHTLTHPCQLNPAAGVTECGHPAHRADAEACRFAVEVFGVAGTGLRSQFNPSGRRKRTRGTCPECGTRRYVTTAGVMLVHDTAAGDRCDGSHRPPAEQVREAS